MIEVNSVRVGYDDVRAVDDVSFAIDDGEGVVLAGANGSGKTTLVRTFNGLVSPDIGTVRVDGTPVHENPAAARQAVSMVFQHPRDGIVAATIGADVAFGPENLGCDRAEIDRRVDRALSAVGLDSRHEDRVDALSGGERARVAIAGALAMEPTHLVLDEPFSGLDEPSRRSLLSHLLELRRDGTSLVIVTHDLRDLGALADRVLVLANGHLMADVPPEDAADPLSKFDVRVPTGWPGSEGGRDSGSLEREPGRSP
ncbi:energy-coupling factor ABC transporter ATP-binding protein [Halopenitus sp. H-Gu1]|uniref:energy-coupling factor ABC transporter ATP-binding protein n=1 Tax=Halopenitus sp. H-Gu1 TaxID=3242697 RepID=UPI00359DC9B4